MFNRQPDHYIEKLTHEQLDRVCNNLRAYGAFDHYGLGAARADFEILAGEYYSSSLEALVTRYSVVIPGYFWKKIKTELSDAAVEELLKGES